MNSICHLRLKHDISDVLIFAETVELRWSIYRFLLDRLYWPISLHHFNRLIPICVMLLPHWIFKWFLFVLVAHFLNPRLVDQVEGSSVIIIWAICLLWLIEIVNMLILLLQFKVKILWSNTCFLLQIRHLLLRTRRLLTSSQTPGRCFRSYLFCGLSPHFQRREHPNFS